MKVSQVLCYSRSLMLTQLLKSQHNDSQVRKKGWLDLNLCNVCDTLKQGCFHFTIIKLCTETFIVLASMSSINRRR